jgi:hypothetical protein
MVNAFFHPDLLPWIGTDGGLEQLAAVPDLQQLVGDVHVDAGTRAVLPTLICCHATQTTPTAETVRVIQSFPFRADAGRASGHPGSPPVPAPGHAPPPHQPWERRPV